MAAPIHQPEYVAIGRIARPHGVKGELKVEPLTEDPGRFGQLDTVFLGRSVEKLTPYQVSGSRFHHHQVLIQFKGINNREEAGRLRSQTIFVPISEAIPLEPGEFFIFQLHGMTVVTEDGQPLGVVQEVIQTGANDVFVVNGGAYGEILLPDTEDVVRNVNGEDRTITVRLLPGLLPPNK